MEDVSKEYHDYSPEFRNSDYRVYSFHSVDDILVNIPRLEFPKGRLIMGFGDFSSKLRKISPSPLRHRELFRIYDTTNEIDIELARWIKNRSDYQSIGRFVFGDVCISGKPRTFKQPRLYVVDMTHEPGGGWELIDRPPMPGESKPAPLEHLKLSREKFLTLLFQLAN